MGNCFPLNTNSSKHEKVLKVIKTDGKILKYKKGMLVKDILKNFSSGYGVVLSNKPSTILPQSYKLKTGNVCYLMKTTVTAADDGASKASATTKRIKLIMTKKELQELLSNKVSIEEMVLGIKRNGNNIISTACSKWRPVLETITEETISTEF